MIPKSIFNLEYFRIFSIKCKKFHLLKIPAHSGLKKFMRSHLKKKFWVKIAGDSNFKPEAY